ncbi:DUF4148 domain-containing protein [Paraburkholderia caballeronis]|uniref:DUF4148 domain-containing protein n=1 Tax=Paraburkholderia caballeronis TaxID=416943 RepID=A0A1H7LQ53_9BURK|nr:DUF4148 domain-containing protein [Paraburkholderia caballeronis]PXW28556.1 uncharacterized protein DUF4148 [Paraburkholderia caballeronis]PXX03922.1 uncharacterized protein DUF4148 [Paraburkholderia caballeronis]RAK04666.1 uncharacterized protein DUF4148 [Paraburkholderia caballeronis]TDV39291.1 uncharacterized protein DUF4148 [Paraburkholderia caballeronis]SED70451.1 protein of unknown function [Paraburkholderia caballeronis]
MKSLIKAVAVAAVLVVPAVSFAQSNQPLTRAEVRNQLIQLEKAGYRPNLNDPHYPDDIQAAQARVQQNGAEATGYGPVAAGSSQSGGGHDGAATSYSPPIYNAR